MSSYMTQISNTYRVTTFYRKMKYNEKSGILICVAINAR